MKLHELIGNTPLVELEHISPKKSVRILGKLEGDNPGGSVKDRTAYGMIEGALQRGEIKRGDKLVEATSGNTGIALAMVAAARGYLPDGVPILKRIAATAGAEACTDGHTLTVAGRTLSRLATDRAARPLPLWQGCRALVRDEVFLLTTDVTDSFDSRYFGPVTIKNLRRRAAPVLVRGDVDSMTKGVADSDHF